LRPEVLLLVPHLLLVLLVDQMVLVLLLVPHLLLVVLPVLPLGLPVLPLGLLVPLPLVFLFSQE
jgi:hypothetical protein